MKACISSGVSSAILLLALPEISAREPPEIPAMRWFAVTGHQTEDNPHHDGRPHGAATRAYLLVQCMPRPIMPWRGGGPVLTMPRSITPPAPSCRSPGRWLLLRFSQPAAVSSERREAAGHSRRWRNMTERTRNMVRTEHCLCTFQISTETHPGSLSTLDERGGSFRPQPRRPSTSRLTRRRAGRAQVALGREDRPPWT